MYNSNFAYLLGNLYAIGGPENFAFVTGKKTQGYIVDIDSGNVKNSFNVADEGFKMPHDVAVTNDGSFVYVVEINPFKIWKLSTGEHGQGYKRHTAGQSSSLLASLWGSLGK